MLYICMFDSEKLELLSKDLVHSIGIDIVDIRKIERIYNKYRERFLDHILTLEEQAQFDVYLKTYGLTQKFYQKLGNTWAAKEAVIKAMNGSVKMKSICVLRGSNGAPYVYLINHINGIQDGLKSIIDGRLIRELLCGKYLCTLNLKYLCQMIIPIVWPVV